MKTPDLISTIMFRIIELTFIIGFLTVLIIFANNPIPPTNHDILVSMLSVLGTCVVGIGGYEWGTSRGSEKKTDIMAASAIQAKADEQVKAQTSTESKVQTEPVKQI
jgi:uncharacterized protein YacL